MITSNNRPSATSLSVSGAHALQAGEVELDQLETPATLRRGLAHFRSRPLRLLQIARRPHNIRAMRHQRTRRFYAETGRNARHQNPFTLQLDARKDIFRR